VLELLEKFVQEEKAFFREDQFITKISSVQLVSQHHLLIRHHAQMSLPGAITCQAA
jgi:hypothetical protein